METLHEVVGTFATPERLESAIDALERAGFDRADLSVLAQRSLINDEPITPAPESAADDAAAPRGAVLPEVDMRQSRTLATSMAGVIAAFAATGAMIVTGGGALAAVVGAAAAGGGASLLAHGAGRLIEHSHEKFLREQAERGGILLWVRLARPEQEAGAKAVLARHGATEVHSHAFPPDRRVAVSEGLPGPPGRSARPAAAARSAPRSSRRAAARRSPP